MQFLYIIYSDAILDNLNYIKTLEAEVKVLL